MDQRTERCIKEYLGKHFFTKDGKVEFEIIAVRSYGDVDIRYCGTDITKNTKIGNIKNGLPNPFIGERGVYDSPVMFEDFSLKYNGTVWQTNEGYYVQIMNYVGTSDVKIRFLNVTPACHLTVTMQNLRKGQIKYPFKRNKFGGYVGMGPYNTNEFSWLYQIWYNMLMRTNGTEYYIKYHGCYTDAYNNAEICDAWLNYNVFADWYLNQLRFLNPNISYDIDKDFLYPIYKYQTDGKKLYSPDTCLLIPHAINAALANFNMSQNKYETEEEYNMNKNNVKAQLHELAKHFWDIKALSADAYALIMMYEPNEWENLTDEDTDRIRKELHKKIRKNEL